MNKLTPRTRTIILFTLALLAIMALSASLERLEMRDGLPPGAAGVQAPSLEGPGEMSELGRLGMLIFRIIMVVTWALAPFLIILLLVSKEVRKELIKQIIAYLPLLLLIYILSRTALQGMGVESEGLAEFSPAGTPAAEVTPSALLPEYKPPPDWVTTLAVIAIAALVTTVIGLIVWNFWRRAQAVEPEPLHKVEREAQAALDAIQSGADLRTAVLRAYLQMVEAARQYRNISRAQDMTPHEFEQLLEQRGLPAGPVHQLTELFEQVRYGAQAPGRAQEQAAVASLSAIISACQRNRAAGAGQERR